MKKNFDQQIDLEKAPVGPHATPLVAKHVVIIGAASDTGANPSNKANVKGYIRGVQPLLRMLVSLAPVGIYDLAKWWYRFHGPPEA